MHTVLRCVDVEVALGAPGKDGEDVVIVGTVLYNRSVRHDLHVHRGSGLRCLVGAGCDKCYEAAQRREKKSSGK